MDGMDLATRLVLATTFVFAAGALVALVWSVMSGQWDGLAAASRIPLDDENDDDGPVAGETDDPGRHAPAV